MSWQVLVIYSTTYINKIEVYCAAQGLTYHTSVFNSKNNVQRDHTWLSCAAFNSFFSVAMHSQILYILYQTVKKCVIPRNIRCEKLQNQTGCIWYKCRVINYPVMTYCSSYLFVSIIGKSIWCSHWMNAVILSQSVKRMRRLISQTVQYWLVL